MAISFINSIDRFHDIKTFINKKFLNQVICKKVLEKVLVYEEKTTFVTSLVEEDQ